MADELCDKNDSCNNVMKEIFKDRTTFAEVGPSRFVPRPHSTIRYSGTTVAHGNLSEEEFVGCLTAGIPIASRKVITVQPSTTSPCVGCGFISFNTGFIGNQSTVAYTATNATWTQANRVMPHNYNAADVTAFQTRGELIANDPYGNYVPAGGPYHGFVCTRLTVRLVNQNDPLQTRSGTVWASNMGSWFNAYWTLDSGTSAGTISNNPYWLPYNAMVLDPEDQPVIVSAHTPLISARYGAATNGISIGHGDHLVFGFIDVAGPLQFEVNVAGYYVGQTVVPECIFTWVADDFYCVQSCLTKLFFSNSTMESRSKDIQGAREHMQIIGLQNQPGNLQWLSTISGALLHKGFKWLLSALT
jgi:hypothetical protein